MLQRFATISKDSIEQPTPTSLGVPLWNNAWQNPVTSVGDGPLASLSPRLLPTYSLGPVRKYEFSRAQKMLQSELSRRCKKIGPVTAYDPKLCSEAASDLAHRLRRVVKLDGLNGVRYKFVVLVSVVQIAPNRQVHQSMAFVSRCLWNRETDGSMTAQAKIGSDMMAVATAFAVYTD